MDSNHRPQGYIFKIPLSYSQWWLGHNPMRLLIEFISFIGVSSLNSDTALICATSICLSYPQIAHIAFGLFSKKILLAFFYALK